MKSVNLGKKEQKLLKASKLGIPISQIDPYIEFLATQRESNQALLNKSEEEVSTVENMLQEARVMRDGLKKKQEEYDKSYQMTMAFKQNPTSTEFEFYSTAEPEVNGKKPREQQISWTKLAGTTLDKLGKFVSGEELVRELFKTYPASKKQAVEVYKGEGTATSLIVQALTAHAALASSRKRGIQEFIAYKEKFGRVTWADKNLIPLPTYMKEFMSASNTVSTSNNSNLVHSTGHRELV
jgi:hypothetical protein